MTNKFEGFSEQAREALTLAQEEAVAIGDKRPGWDTYFLTIAEAVAARATCPRASVGVVIIKDKRILSAGYNGAAESELHCVDVGCLIENGHCQRAIHAETNAIAQAAKFGIPISGATLYYWDSQSRPVSNCIKCSQLIKAAGIAKVVSRLGVEVL